MNYGDFTVLVSGDGRHCWVSMCTVPPSLQNDWVGQQICIKFCIKLEHPYTETIQMFPEGHSYGQLVIGSFITTTHPLIHHVSCRVFWQNIKSPGWLCFLTARLGSLWLLAFPKTKITFIREKTSYHWWDLGKYNRAADGD